LTHIKKYYRKKIRL